MNYIYRVLDYMAWFWFMEWLILVYIINRIIHGSLEIWNLSSRVHIRYLTRSLHSLVRYRCEHSKINSISPRDHVLFSIYVTPLKDNLNRFIKSCLLIFGDYNVQMKKKLVKFHLNSFLRSAIHLSVVGTWFN